MSDILLVSADLFLGSRVRGAADAAGRGLDVASTGAAAIERLNTGQYRLVLIDLETPQLDFGDLLADRSGRSPAAFVAYGPHVRAGLLDRARQAGCGLVLTRGQFDASLKDLLARFLKD
ncbi:MAG: histidine kinase [Planctomycetaceae bacterium]